MKQVYLILFYLIFSIPSFGQQYLWSTANDTTSQHVPLENVNNEVLQLFEQYKFYQDGAGYNKDTFFKDIDIYAKSSSTSWTNFKEEIRKIKKLTVFAIRTNHGKGSEVVVIFITKDNVNLITFTNTYDNGHIMTFDHEKENFGKWLETLKV